MKNENDNNMSARLDQILKIGPEESEKQEKKSQSDKLVELVEREDCVLFHDQFKEPYAHVLINGHRESWRIKSKQFKRWLSAKYWDVEGKAPNTNSVSAALTILEGKACFGGQKIMLENRVTMIGGTIWYDLSNENWQAVKITEQGWEVVDNPPILFRRHSHQNAQLLPVRSGGDLKALLPFVNLANKEHEELLLVYLVSCFIPEIPHPIPILYGPQGAAKTTLARMLRALIDPSSIGVLSMPTVANDLVQLISHHWFAFFDNVTFMPDWVSDALCRAVTGEGFSKRELYSDDEDVIYNFRRCIGLNGINMAARKPDLLDRGILLKLDRIATNQRKGEREIWKAFELARPVILGGIFDALSGAMRHIKDIHLSEVPRMADFTLWGCAIAEALTGSSKNFLETYLANIGDQHDEAIQENVVATVILTFMEEKGFWEGTPSQLLKELTQLAAEDDLNSKGSGWPKTPNLLTRRINEVKTNLAEKNISIESEKGTNGKRIIVIQKHSKNDATVATTASTFDAVLEVFGGEVVEDGGTLKEVLPPDDHQRDSQDGKSGNDGADFGLPF